MSRGWEPYEYESKTLPGDVQQITRSFVLDGFPQTQDGLVNAKGDSLAPVFNGVLPWSDNSYFVFTDLNGEAYKDYWGFVVDKNFRASEAYHINIGTGVAVKRGDKWGVINRFDGYIVIPFQFDDMGIVRTWKKDGKRVLAVPARKNGGWALVTLGAELLTRYEYEAMAFTPINLYGVGLMVKQKGQWRVMDENWNYVIPFAYDSIKMVTLEKMIVKIGSGWGLIWRDGGSSTQWWQTPFEFEEFRSGYKCNCARKNGKWAAIDTSPQALPITKFEYDGVFGSGWWEVVPLKKNNKWGFYNCKKKSFVTDFLYDEILNIENYKAIVLQNGQKIEIEY